MGGKRSRPQLVELLDGPCKGLKVARERDGTVIGTRRVGCTLDFELHEYRPVDERSARWVRLIGVEEVAPRPASPPMPAT